MCLAKQKTIDPKPRAMQPRVLSENFERHGKNDVLCFGRSRQKYIRLLKH